MIIRSSGIILSLLVFISPSYAEVSPESIIQIFQRLETLEKKSRELTGENEVLKHQIDQLKKVQKQGFLNVDERIDELADSIKPNTDEKIEPNLSKNTEKTVTVKLGSIKPTPPSPDLKKDKEQTKTDKTSVSKSDARPAVKVFDANDTQKKSREPTAYEKETYQTAFNKMNASPTAATKSFQEYIKLQPNSPLAANSQYWVGEIMYSHNNYKGAIQEFIKVLQKYKDSNKAPDAAIKLGYSFYALKNWAYARRTFEDVLKYFPENKNAVNLATQRLEKMKAAGH